MKRFSRVLKLHIDIYPPAAVSKTAAEFKALASFSLARKGAYTVISFVSCQPPYDLHTLRHLFATYALMRAQTSL
jgi:hypothetical protein